MYPTIQGFILIQLEQAKTQMHTTSGNKIQTFKLLISVNTYLVCILNRDAICFLTWTDSRLSIIKPPPLHSLTTK